MKSPLNWGGVIWDLYRPWTTPPPFFPRPSWKVRTFDGMLKKGPNMRQNAREHPEIFPLSADFFLSSPSKVMKLFLDFAHFGPFETDFWSEFPPFPKGKWGSSPTPGGGVRGWKNRKFPKGPKHFQMCLYTFPGVSRCVCTLRIAKSRNFEEVMIFFRTQPPTKSIKRAKKGQKRPKIGSKI